MGKRPMVIVELEEIQALRIITSLIGQLESKGTQLPKMWNRAQAIRLYKILHKMLVK